MRQQTYAADGSPPRAWGGRGTGGVEPDDGRLTPTCVGRTSPAPPAGPARTAHPHVRGEDECRGGRRSPPGGSPPRAWGGRRDNGIRYAIERLTPTCVGRTVCPHAVHRNSAAHPHVRGEDRCRHPQAKARAGSPPRAWGGPGRHHRSQLVQGLTPTCVGRTRRHV